MEVWMERVCWPMELMRFRRLERAVDLRKRRELRLFIKHLGMGIARRSKSGKISGGNPTNYQRGVRYR
jgi:hypothetical protein